MGARINIRSASLAAVSVVIVSAGTLDFVPQVTSPESAIFVGTFALAIVLTFARVITDGVVAYRGADVFALIILFLTMVSAVPANLNGVPFTDWLRGAIPFFFYSFFLLLNGLDRRRELRVLLVATLVSCFIWAFKVTLQTYAAIPQVLAGDLGRLTYVTMDLTVPMALIGFSLCLFLRRLPTTVRISGIAIFAMFIVLSGYRSQLMLAALLGLVYIGSLNFFRQVSIALAVIIVTFVLLVTGPLDPVIDSIGSRFSTIGDEVNSVRAQELRFALGSFAEAPVFGKGLSYPIPIWVTRPPEYWEVYETSSLRYIHSLPGYLLMDLGAAGFVAFIGFWATCFFAAWRRKRTDVQVYAAFWTAVALLGFFFVSAAFRQIQTTVLLMVLLHVCCGEQNRRGRQQIDTDHHE